MSQCILATANMAASSNFVCRSQIEAASPVAVQDTRVSERVSELEGHLATLSATAMNNKKTLAALLPVRQLINADRQTLATMLHVSCELVPDTLNLLAPEEATDDWEIPLQQTAPWGESDVDTDATVAPILRRLQKGLCAVDTGRRAIAEAYIVRIV